MSFVRRGIAHRLVRDWFAEHWHGTPNIASVLAELGRWRILADYRDDIAPEALERMAAVASRRAGAVIRAVTREDGEKRSDDRS